MLGNISFSYNRKVKVVSACNKTAIKIKNNSISG